MIKLREQAKKLRKKLVWSHFRWALNSLLQATCVDATIFHIGKIK
jgi:hypothetical protein